MTGDLALWIAIAAAIVGGALSTLHMSLREASRPALEDLARARGLSARIAKILEASNDHALAVSLPRILCNLIVLVAMLVWFTGVGPDSVLTWGALAKSMGLAVALIYFLGIVAPASVSDHAGERVVVAGSGLLRTLYYIVLPLARVGRFVDALVKRISGARPHTRAEEIEREILSVVEEGQHEGSIGESERMMIEGVVDLRSSVAREIMRPRTEIRALAYTDDLSEVREHVEAAGHSRVPVYEGDLDRIVGVLYTKDLLGWVGRPAGAFRLRDLLREPHFIPESKPLLSLLAEFKRTKVHMAIVLDEYGVASGLVTIEDLLEEIVGDIVDEHDEPSDEPAPVVLHAAERAAEIDARTTIVDANEQLEPLGVALPESEEYDSVGGWVLWLAGRIPVTGESMVRDGRIIKVLDAGPMRVSRVRVEFGPAAGTSQPEEARAAGGA